MPSTTYYIRIKKSYASDVIKDLEKMDALELMETPPIPEWQKKQAKKRLKSLQNNPSKAVSWKDATKKIKQLAK